MYPQYLPSIVAMFEERHVLFFITAAWAFLALWAVTGGVRLLRRDRADALAFGALFLGALALRLAVPSGPLGFVEAERLHTLWGTSFGIVRPFLGWSSLLGLLRGAGLSPASLFRYGNPLAGSLGVALTFALARAAGLSRPSAVAAGCALLAWPAHVRYSAGADFVIPGSALWTGAFAAALSQGIGARWRLPLLLAACMAGAEIRPEYVLCAATVVLLAGDREGFRWTWFALAASTALIVLSGRTSRQNTMPWDWSRLSPAALRLDYQALLDPRLTPMWWVVAGGVGLVLGRLSVRVRLAFVVTTLALAAIYVTFGGESNPLWGLSRYSLSFVPLLLVGAAATIERLLAPVRARVAALAAVAGLLSAPLYLRLLRHPVNMQLEFAYLGATAPRALANTQDVLMLDEPAVGGHGGQWVPQSLPALALGLAVRQVDIMHVCPQGPHAVNPRALRLWPARIFLAGCPLADEARRAGRLAAYVGVFRPEASMRELQSRVRLTPTDERTLAGASVMPLYDRQCPPRSDYAGASLPDCPVRVGWYRVAP